MKVYLLPALLFLAIPSFAQEENKSSNLTFSGFADVFYQFDLNKPIDNARPGFLYNHNRHNEVNVNLAYLKAAYATDRVRGNLALMAGTYVQDNLSNESPALQHLYEANVGFQIAPKWWLDAGIMPSHIGFESAKSNDCATLTRSLLAEYSPYFETGAKLSFAPNAKLSVSLLWLNGWQRMARAQGNQTPNFGTQILWKPSDKFQFNYSTFVGSDLPKTKEITRIFHNFYGILSPNANWQLTMGLDAGTEINRSNRDSSSFWYSPVAILRWQCSAHNAIALRAEHYADPDAVILSDGQSTTGFSLNFDRKISSNVLWRIEGKYLQADKAVFANDKGANTKTRPYLTTSVSIGF